ncbi:NCS2 family permease [Treponema parvum]|uniref:NCS2 family permease n=1 Tax=Treponema parvum TaxID=138851 RepID=A0A975F0Q0_9SPIR|nr:NCS2 family permease [Treponema parvum]QTQ12248.1 NCS2 family permease [Treponema parvum]QTQ15769.1 NCS2 family permease [Treponema parvum]
MEKMFKLKAHGTTVRTEVIAGITTFLAMAYILAVNPGMLSQTGMPIKGVFTATALSAGIATLVMAFLANLPVALAPGMGLNAFFTFTVVMGMGYSWQLALTAVFIEGIVFIILSFFNIREKIIDAIPNGLKKAISVGIGLFIALIGLTNAGIVSSQTGTIIGFADLSGAPLVAVIGLAVTCILYCCKVPGSILLGIIITTVIGVPFGVTKIPQNFTPFSLPAAPIFCQFEFSQIFTIKFFTVFFTFFFVDVFDTIGTLVGVTTEAGLAKNGKIPHVKEALLSDAIGTVAGAMLGTSTVTSFVESTSGVAAGGRTGLTSAVTGILFFLALFLSPLFLLVPSAATAPALIIVGFFMLRCVVDINFADPTEGIPAFICIITMPFAYSVAEGIVWGLVSYVILKVVTGKAKSVTIVGWILFFIFILRWVLK